jgi:hypothetical protein
MWKTEIRSLSLILYKKSTENRSKTVRPETLKLLEENIGKNTSKYRHSNNLPNRTPIFKEIRA